MVYGVSNNTQSWWRDDDAERIGYQPRDSADTYREELMRLYPDEVGPAWQGGNIFMRDYRKPETLVNQPTRLPQDWPAGGDPNIGGDC